MEPSAQSTSKLASQNPMLAGPIMDIAPPKQDGFVAISPATSQTSTPAVVSLPSEDDLSASLTTGAPEVPSDSESVSSSVDDSSFPSKATDKTEQPKNSKRPGIATRMPVAVLIVAVAVCALLIVAAFMVYKKS